ncbi:TlpA disulfide reductase family protein [Accumulibacter sp.]|uniref:TlpA family protein disulfide reductase n=1 Tax=Accumulibacter sp. TaxID=2053492 RepID=UPI0026154541|nr:TlpA disulfide reductase family protein [Accumulibacter sp.]
MKPQTALALAVAAGLLTLASIAFLAYRLLEQTRSPIGGRPADLISSPQLNPPDGQAAADAIMKLTLPDLAGRPQALAQWRGKILVVNFWASWCTPCVEEMPAFSRLHSQYAGRGVQFVGIGIDEPDKLRAFVETRPVSYPLLAATPAISQTPGLEIRGLPYTLVIGRRGAIELSRLGRLDEAKLEPVLQRLTLP